MVHKIDTAQMAAPRLAASATEDDDCNPSKILMERLMILTAEPKKIDISLDMRKEGDILVTRRRCREKVKWKISDNLVLQGASVDEVCRWHRDGAGRGPGGSGVRFVGEDGTVEVTRNNVSADPSELIEKPVEELPEQLQRSTNHYRDWLECIKDRRDPIAPVEAGHRTATVGHLANIARWVSAVTGITGETLRWDPVEERFTNSDVANQFLHRPGHGPHALPDKV